jgi:hypothetical protein
MERAMCASEVSVERFGREWLTGVRAVKDDGRRADGAAWAREVTDAGSRTVPTPCAIRSNDGTGT